MLKISRGYPMAADVTVDYALVNGKRSVYTCPWLKPRRRLP